MTKLKTLILILLFLVMTYLVFIIGSNIFKLSEKQGNDSKNIDSEKFLTEEKENTEKNQGSIENNEKYSNKATNNQGQNSSQTVNTQKDATKTTNIRPKTFKIVVDTDLQKVFIYDKVSNKLYKEFICSTGIDGKDETVKGNFKIQDRGYSFFNPKYQDGAYYWVRFYKTYLFHSIPFDKNEKVIEKEAAKLGEKASHGCVRLSIEEAKWFYDNIPKGTEVTVK
jgi:lipoprotein-anchoring transpeptidase ErfK/SrfK